MRRHERKRAALSRGRVLLLAGVLLGASPQDGRDEIARARQRRAGLLRTRSDLGILVSSRYRFALLPRVPTYEAHILLGARGQMRIDLVLPGSGSMLQILDGDRAYAERRQVEQSGEISKSGSYLNKEAVEAFRAKEILYRLLLRFPHLGADFAISPAPERATREDTFAVAVRCRGIEALVECDRRSALAKRITIGAGDLICSQITWGRVATLPPGLLVPRTWSIRAKRPVENSWSETTQKVLFDMSGPADLIAAHLAPPGERRIEHRPEFGSGSEACRWDAHIAADLQVEQSWPLDLPGLLAFLEASEGRALDRLADPLIRGPAAAIDLRAGELQILGPGQAGGHSPALAENTAMVTHFIPAPLASAQHLGAVSLSRRGAQLLFAPRIFADAAGSRGLSLLLSCPD